MIIILLGGLLLCAGCDQATSPSDPKKSISISTDEILDRCVASIGRLKTLQARGTIRDNRREDRRVRPIAWDFARPGKCRLQIDMDVTIVVDDAWWTYDATSHEYKKHKSFTRTPMDTAAFLMSKGVSFLLPAVFARGEAAFGKSRVRGYSDWLLLGVAWLDEHPCYVVSRKGQGRDSAYKLRVWIDQDSYFVRGWDLIEPGENGRDAIVVGVTYHMLTGNAAVASDRFALTLPTPIQSGRVGTERAEQQSTREEPADAAEGR